MALSFGDIALSIGAGVAEKDMAIRDAEFKQALDNFKEEKAHTKKLAELRYARDLKTYDDEVAKLDRVKSIYALAAKADPLEAGKLIASAEYDGYENLSEQGKIDLGTSIASNFKYNYKTYKEGDELPEGAKVGDRVMFNGQPVIESFSFGRKDYTLNEPQPNSYYMDSKFWKDEEEKLDKSSFVTKQLRNLFGKEPKEIDNIDYAEKIQNKKVNEVKTLLDDEAEYTSTNLGGGQLKGNRLYKVKDSEKDANSRMTKMYDESTGITTDAIKSAVISPIVSLSKDIAKNYQFNQVSGKLEVSGDGQNLGYESNILWNAVNDAKLFSVQYYDSIDAKGNNNVGEFRAFNQVDIRTEYNQKWKERALFLNNKQLIGKTQLSGITLIPLDLLPLSVSITEKERELIQNNVNIAIKDVEGNINANESLIRKTIEESLITIDNNRKNTKNENEVPPPGDNKGPILTEKILKDTMDLNKDKSQEEIIKNFEDMGYTIPQNLKIGSNQGAIPEGNVPPRPDGSAGRKWDREYGNTHNADGTPKT
jgi:acid phosphatase class B